MYESTTCCCTILILVRCCSLAFLLASCTSHSAFFCSNDRLLVASGHGRSSVWVCPLHCKAPPLVFLGTPCMPKLADVY